MGAELLHADRRTDSLNEVNSRFSQFCEESNKAIAMFLAVKIQSKEFRSLVMLMLHTPLKTITEWCIC